MVISLSSNLHASATVLRIVSGNGVFRRHGKRRIHLHFALRNFDEAAGMTQQGPALRERQYFAPLIAVIEPQLSPLSRPDQAGCLSTQRSVP